MKKVILIGKSGSGKTSLCQRLSSQDMKYCKTQSVQLINETFLDTPGEYLERPRMRGALSVTAADAQLILFIQEAAAEDSMFPPGYASSFNKPCVGVVSKADMADGEQTERAKNFLKMAGASKIFVTSAREGQGLYELAAFLEDGKR
ncbi:EutP/PduV family microcompartment system protein [Ruminococcus sp. OA3]|uniref:EutP/PduV family microcompartment system protein n=1 Tax=Ruminococcus sp. OA3 TaxID=2914164 RepID=UPI001F05C20A|nr:EutP/PduV family microcompartment system protein [Ruminococcus sp. OA3]MCH1984459.1 EutP/PduV family microcompartment system protein [Ruminococcus sp. OA3]